MKVKANMSFTSQRLNGPTELQHKHTNKHAAYTVDRESCRFPPTGGDLAREIIPTRAVARVSSWVLCTLFICGL